MPLSNNLASYEDLRVHLDRALASERGIKLTYDSAGKAIHQQHRCYKFRSLERLASCDTFEVGDERRGTSAYDFLNFKADGNELYITHGTPVSVEEL